MYTGPSIMKISEYHGWRKNNILDRENKYLNSTKLLIRILLIEFELGILYAHLILKCEGKEG